MTELVKVHFRLEQDDDGYPPASVESLWATPGSRAEEYVLDNIPFFARDATIGDTIIVRREDDLQWFDALVQHSTNSLLRAIFFIEDQVERVSQRLIDLGCSVEYMKAYKLLAINVPGDVKLASIQDYLGKEAAEGTLDYEEPILRQ